MAARKTFADHPEFRETAMRILKSCGGDREIILSVQKLMNSPDDSLLHHEALWRLRLLLERCTPQVTERNDSPSSLAIE
jgi:hypothetical protein